MLTATEIKKVYALPFSERSLISMLTQVLPPDDRRGRENIIRAAINKPKN